MNSYFAFESVKRSLSVLPQTNNEDIIAYFSKVSADAKIGNISKSKKILSEQEMVNILKEQSPKAINIIKSKPLAFTSMENF